MPRENVDGMRAFFSWSLGASLLICAVSANAKVLSNEQLVQAVRAKNDSRHDIWPGDARVIARGARRAKVLVAFRGGDALRVETVSTLTGKVLGRSDNLMPSVRAAVRAKTGSGSDAYLDLTGPMTERGRPTVRLKVLRPEPGRGKGFVWRNQYRATISSSGNVLNLMQEHGTESENLKQNYNTAGAF
jgi:hypothetical protein